MKSPRIIFGAYGVVLLAWLLTYRYDWLFPLSGLLGYGCALALCLSVAQEHRKGSWLRFAWTAFAWNAAASMVRHAADTALWDRVWPGYSGGVEIALIRQTAIVVGLGCLLAGVGAMVSAFHRAGVGLSPLRRDVVAILGVFAILATILYYRQGLAEANSPSAWARHLQQAGLILLAASAACSILVYRLSRQMSGGRLAVTMLYLVGYTALRCILVCLSLFPEMRPLMDVVRAPLDFAVPWLFALAAVYRFGIAAHAAAQIPQSIPLSCYLKQTTHHA